ncbi:MAG: histidinol-phosphate aminotransferase [Cyanobacteria bacterium SW_8_48_13]|nr:MAG: histidinol-phosphate aminotransferase [Cyanobacteria bacterium SW_8_48_13]
MEFIRSDIAKLSAYAPEVFESPTEPLDKLDANESPFDLPLEIKEKLAWHYQHFLATNRYPSGSHADLQEAIANYVNESASLDAAITPAHISVGNGSDELIRSLLIATCIGGEGAILIAQPTFSVYGIMAQTLGIPAVSVGRSLTDFAMNLSEAEEAIAQTDNPPIRVVFVVHPNSPTANPLTSAELDWLRRLPEHILVVIDEAYFEFSQTSVVGELPQHPNWVVLRTFSKAFRLAAHRVGYCIAHPQLIAALEKIRLPYNLTAFSQAAALVALNHRQLLLQSIPTILSERERLFQALSQHPTLQVWQSAANFLYLRLKTATPEIAQEQHSQFTQALKAQGTLVRSTGGGIRINVGSREENPRAQERVEAFLNRE